MGRGSTHARWEMAAGSVEQFDAEIITGGAVTAWLRNTTLSGNISSVTDLLNVNPAAQSVDGRRPAGAADGSMTWAENPDNLVWPVAASNFNTATVAYAFWFDPDSVAGATVLLELSAVTGGASVNTLSIQTSGARIAAIVYDPDVGGANGRVCQTPVSSIVAAPQFLTFEFDGAAVTEATEIVMTLNAGAPVTVSFSNLGAPTVPIDTLAAPTGNYVLGNGQNAVAGSAPFAGRFGRNFFVATSKMAGATTGIFTPAARTALMNFEQLV